MDRTVASQVAVGGISALTYANSLIMLVQNGLVDPINTVFYPQVTEAVASNDNVEARRAIEKVLNYVLALLIPISAGFIVFRSLITNSLFGRGAFDATASQMTAEALCFYAVGICFIGIREMLSRFYYAHSNTSIPMRNSVIGVAINIVMNLVLSRFWGIAGLAVATSISAAVTALLLWGECDKHLHCGMIAISIKDIVKTIIASFLSIGVAYRIDNIIELPNLLELIVAIVVSVLMYCALGFLLKIELFSSAIAMVKEKSIKQNK